MSYKNRLKKLEIQLGNADRATSKRMYMIEMDNDRGLCNINYLYTMDKFDNRGVAGETFKEDIESLKEVPKEYYDSWKGENVRENDIVIIIQGIGWCN